MFSIAVETPNSYYLKDTELKKNSLCTAIKYNGQIKNNLYST